MELKELLLAFAEGKKLSRKHWNQVNYIHIVNNKFVDCNGHEFIPNMDFGNDWELYQEKVPFTAALQAFKDGKTIMRVDWKNIDGCCWADTNNSPDYRFSIKDIESDWIILD